MDLFYVSQLPILRSALGNERTVGMYVMENRVAEPFFSICIPQYNRTSFLTYALKELAKQTCPDFEVCISDDRSTDGREVEIINALRESGLSFVYKQRDKNSGYDVNLRSSIELARGHYCILMGNDDCLASPTVLEDIQRYLTSVPEIGAGITNFCDFASRKISLRRAERFEIVGAGPEVGIRYYRNATFLSGVVLNKEVCAKFSTDLCDGTDFYQIFMMVRIVASGLPLVKIPIVAVRKDIVLAGETVENSFLNAPVINPCPILERRHKTLMGYGIVLSNAIRPYVDEREYNRLMRLAMMQFYVFTCTFWIFQYKQIQSFNYAVGIVLGVRPRNVLPAGLSRFSRVLITICYVVVATLGLLIPKLLFFKLMPALYEIVKRSR